MHEHDEWIEARRRMVDTQIRTRGVQHPGVLRAMTDVPRHEFVPREHRADAYEDRPLPIGYGQTISQPYMVAAMTAALDPHADDQMLEVGTGSAYQAAVLARLVASVCTIEWVPELADRARAVLDRLGIDNVEVLTGDGTLGIPGRTFDGIVVTAGGPDVPAALVEQLDSEGRLVMPCGDRYHQVLTILRRHGSRVEQEQREGCVFVPLQGEGGFSPASR